MGKRSVAARVGHPDPDARGNTLYNDEHGEWRSVPGFLETVLIVSSLGWIRCKPRRDRPMGSAFLPMQHPEGYRHVINDDWSYRVCHLVLWAFSGGPRERETADHIAKHGGDFMKERGDDRAENLRWATKSQQSNNRTMLKPQARSMPVFARHESWTAFCPPRLFTSLRVASEVLGVIQGNISNVLGTQRNACTTGGWAFEWAESDECQEDLVTDADGVEKWTSIGQRGCYKVSTHGRCQTMRGRSTNWGPRRTPMPTRGRMYSTLRVDGKLEYMHDLVWGAFGNRPLVDDETVDHVRSTEKWNNCLSNLRPATKSEQRANQVRAGGVKRRFE